MDGVWLNDGGGVDVGIGVIGGDGIKDELIDGIMVVGPFVWLEAGIGDGIGTQSSSQFHLDAFVQSFDGVLVIRLVGSGARPGDGIGIDVEGGIAERLKLGTVLVGSLLGFGNGSKDSLGLMAELVGVGVCTDDDGIGLGGVDGIAEKRGVGSVVVGCLVVLCDCIITCLSDELGDKVGLGFGKGVLS